MLLPGLDGTGALFAPFLKAWSGPAPVVIGYPRDRFLDHVQCAEFALERLPAGEPLALLGESFSGPVAVLLAARLPERVQTLILCASFVTAPRGALPRALLRAAAPVAFRIPAPRLALRELLLNGHGDQDLLELVCTNRKTVRPSVLARRFQTVMRCDVRRELALTRQPLLYLRADRDRLVTRASVEAIRAVRPDVSCKAFPAPHFVLQTVPAEAARALEGHLGLVAASRHSG